MIKVKAVIEGQSFCFVNIYAPNEGKERSEFLKIVDQVLVNCASEDRMFIAGDFNCTVNCKEDRNHPEPHPQSARELAVLIKKHGLVDVWKNIHGDKRQYTWVKYSKNNFSMARLDRVYVFKEHLNLIKQCHKRIYNCRL